MSDAATRVRERLARYAEGVHYLGPAQAVLDSALPDGLRAVWHVFDGGALFHEALMLVPSREAAADGTRWQVGEVEGDDLAVDRDTGAVWRLEQDTGEWVEEGTAFDRWLFGWVMGQAVLVDDEGEYRDGVFDEEGELLPAAAARVEEEILGRDKGAPAPRWRLARALVREGRLERARDELEELVSRRPAFAWAWFDMARIAERLGDLEAAASDMREAGSANPTYEHAPFFWAHAARLAAAVGDEAGRAEAAARALSNGPALVSIHRDAAEQSFEEGELEAAREHVALARALAPRDVAVLELARRIG